MELKDLVGEHILDAVDFSNEEIKTWGDEFELSQVMRFRIDGIVYAVVEDPSDGYRSSMRDIHVSDASMINVFPPIRVVGRYRGGDDDVLEFIEINSGNIILEAGTQQYGDYYPYFVASFNPENIVGE